MSVLSPALRDIFHTTMARYSLFVLLNNKPNQPNLLCCVLPWLMTSTVVGHGITVKYEIFVCI